MKPKIPEDSIHIEWNIQKQLDAYREAAEYDDFMFGDFDYEKEWLGEKPSDIS